MSNLAQITKSQFNRTVKQFRSITNNLNYVEFYDGAFWVLGSDVDVFRLKEKYQDCQKTSYGFSKSFGSWYFRLETASFAGNMSTN